MWFEGMWEIVRVIRVIRVNEFMRIPFYGIAQTGDNEKFALVGETRQIERRPLSYVIRSIMIVQ